MSAETKIDCYSCGRTICGQAYLIDDHPTCGPCKERKAPRRDLRRHGGVPGYLFLAAMAAVMIGLGIIGVVVGAIYCISLKDGKATSFVSFIPGLLIIGCSAALAGIGEGLRALRDVAQNSFRK